MNSSQCRDYLGRLQQFGIKLSLDNIGILLDELGSPQEYYPSVLVAGTNGKGSVSAMLTSILQTHGFKTGLYTSPHLVGVEERVRVDGIPIGGRRFCFLLGRIKETVNGLLAEKRLPLHPTFFEVITALALLEYRERNVDIAVLEVGMGGRFDATNVVNPILSVITTISKDHEKHLGRNLRAIAFEKTGILRSGIPVVCGVRRGTAYAEIKRRAAEKAAPFIGVFDSQAEVEAIRSKKGYRFVFQTGGEAYAFRLPLEGRHQGENAAVAITAARILDHIWRPMSKILLLRGLRKTRWEGRLEKVSSRPPVILDGAHNEEGARSLAAYLEGIVGKLVILVFALMKDKNVRPMANVLFPHAHTIILTPVANERSAPPEDIKTKMRAFSSRILIAPDVRQAVQLALAISKGRIPVVVAGSLYLVGEVKKLELFP